MIFSKYNKKMLYRNFAHALGDITKVQYTVDNNCNPNRKGGMTWDDPTLAIDWPAEDPILSKNMSRPTFETAVNRDVVF